MEYLSIKSLPIETKIQLLKELGYDSDGKYVLDNKGQKVKDQYIDITVTLDKMLILPGSTIILDDNPISIAAYFEEHANE